MAFRKGGFAALSLTLAACMGAQAAGAAGKSNDGAAAFLSRANYYRSALSKEQDPGLAFHWMREAALKGLPAAQFELARMLLEGRGAAFDPIEAQKWLQKASAKEKRAVALLAKISHQPPQPPPAIPKHATSASQLTLAPSTTARNGTAGVGDAAARGDTLALEALLRAGASVEAPGPDGMTPLMCAALEGRLEATRLLLRRGADANARNKKGETALVLALLSRRSEVAGQLLSNDKVSQATLNAAVFAAAEACDEAALVRLREKDARPTPKTEGQTPLMRAAARCPARITEVLTPAPDVNAVDKSGRSALRIAAEHGNAGSVAALLRQGASPNLSDRIGVTPLIAALEHGHEEAALLLIRASADLSAATRSGQTALIVAAHRGLKAAILEALDRGADPNARDALGVSALMAAAQNGHAEIVGALLARGADPKLRNKKRETAIELATGEKTRSLLSN